MKTMFVDLVSGQFFMADYIKVRQVLNNIERRSEHEGYLMKWDEYFKGLNLPMPLWCKSLPYMGRADNRCRIKFELYPQEDEDDGELSIVIHVLR